MVSVVASPLPEESIDALVHADPADLGDDDLARRLIALHRVEALVAAAKTKTTGLFDARAVWSRDAARNGPGWVAAHTGASYGTAKGDQDLARALRAMPVTEAAFGRGDLSRDQARLLAKARVPELADAFDACEEILVTEVARITVAAAARFLRRW